MAEVTRDPRTETDWSKTSLFRSVHGTDRIQIEKNGKSWTRSDQDQLLLKKFGSMRTKRIDVDQKLENLWPIWTERSEDPVVRGFPLESTNIWCLFLKSDIFNILLFLAIMVQLPLCMDGNFVWRTCIGPYLSNLWKFWIFKKISKFDEMYKISITGHVFCLYELRRPWYPALTYRIHLLSLLIPNT